MNSSSVLKFSLFLILLLTHALSVSGQTDWNSENFKTIDVEDGLPSNRVTALTIDKKGFIWLGTRNGLTRFDGSYLRNFRENPNSEDALESNFISALETDNRGSVWIGTSDAGIFRFTDSTATFEHYGLFRPITKPKNGEQIVRIRNLGKTGIWVSAEGGGIARYNAKTNDFTTYRTPDFDDSYINRQTKIISDILEDPNDYEVLWLPSYYGLWKFNIKSENWTHYQELPPAKMSNLQDIKSMRKAAFGTDGKLYINVFRRGVMRFDPETESWKQFTEADYNPLHFKENNFEHIALRDSNSFWLGSSYRGMAILNLTTERIELLGNCGSENPNDLCNTQVNNFLFDETGTLFLATNSGLRIYTQSERIFKKIAISTEKPHLKGRLNINSVFPLDENRFVVGGYAGEGIYIVNRRDGTINLIEPPEGFKVGQKREMFWVTDIISYSENKLLVVTAYNLYFFNKNTLALEKAPSELDTMDTKGYYWKIDRHSNGNFYLTSRHNGVFVLDEALNVIDNLTKDPTNANSLTTSNYIFDLEEDPDGNMWIGTEEGVSIYNPNELSFKNLDYEARKDSLPMLKFVFQTKLHPDSSMWLTDGKHGIGRIAYPYTEPFEIELIDSRDGLLTDKVHSVLHLNQKSTMVINSGGLTSLSSEKPPKNFTVKQGFPETRTLSPIVETPDGSIAVGAKNVVSWFHPQDLETVRNDIPLYIASIQIFQDELDSNQVYDQREKLTLSYRQNFISIKMGMVNLIDPENFKIAYRLKGFDENWVETGAENLAVFTNIPGGNYTFEARITDINNRILPARISFPIRIIPPFWETWWFIALCILFVTGIVSTFYYLRIGSIRREERIKTEFNKKLANTELSALRAQMNPHFLFNSINSIRHKIIKNDMLEAEKYLVKFSSLVRMVLENSRHQMVLLSDELSALQLYMELESMRFDHRFVFHVSNQHGVETEKLLVPPMLIQPYVENAIWHGLMQKKDAGKVMIGISIVEKNLVINIEDDGIGREKAAELNSKSALKKESMGMKITGSRLEIIEKIYHIRCKAEVTDLKDATGNPKGTHVKLTLPLLRNYENSHSR